MKVISKKYRSIAENDIVLLKGVQATYLKEEEQPRFELVRKSNLL